MAKKGRCMYSQKRANISHYNKDAQKRELDAIWQKARLSLYLSSDNALV